MSGVSEQAVDWYYEKGGVYGPFNEYEMIELINEHKISADTNIWKIGEADWVDADMSIFRKYFTTSEMPKKETISNLYAWLYAVVPFCFSLILSFVIPEEHSRLISTVSTALLVSFWATDMRLMKKLGFSGWLWTGLFIPPVYLFMRASKTNKQYGYAIANTIIFTLGIIGLIGLFLV